MDGQVEQITKDALEGSWVVVADDGERLRVCGRVGSHQAAGQVIRGQALLSREERYHVLYVPTGEGRGFLARLADCEGLF